MPALKPGDIVIVKKRDSDNGRTARRTIRVAGAKLSFLLPYSSDRAGPCQVQKSTPKSRWASCRGNEPRRGRPAAFCRRNAPTISLRPDPLQRV